jgi:hypothetical protein
MVETVDDTMPLRNVPARKLASLLTDGPWRTTMLWGSVAFQDRDPARVRYRPLSSSTVHSNSRTYRITK